MDVIHLKESAKNLMEKIGECLCNGDFQCSMCLCAKELLEKCDQKKDPNAYHLLISYGKHKELSLLSKAIGSMGDYERSIASIRGRTATGPIIYDEAPGLSWGDDGYVSIGDVPIGRVTHFEMNHDAPPAPTEERPPVLTQEELTALFEEADSDAPGFGTFIPTDLSAEGYLSIVTVIINSLNENNQTRPAHGVIRNVSVNNVEVAVLNEDTMLLELIAHSTRTGGSVVQIAQNREYGINMHALDEELAEPGIGGMVSEETHTEQMNDHIRRMESTPHRMPNPFEPGTNLHRVYEDSPRNVSYNTTLPPGMSDAERPVRINQIIDDVNVANQGVTLQDMTASVLVDGTVDEDPFIEVDDSYVAPVERAPGDRYGVMGLTPNGGVYSTTTPDNFIDAEYDVLIEDILFFVNTRNASAYDNSDFVIETVMVNNQIVATLDVNNGVVRRRDNV